MERETLAAWIADWPVPEKHDAPDAIPCLLAAATGEGVVALAHAALTRRTDAPEALCDAFAAAAREGAVGGMLRVAECRRVLDTMAEAGIPVLLLKGLALAAWLYPHSYLRESSDIDLLFAGREDAERAAALLASSGYAVQYSAGVMAQEFLCRRQVGAMGVDVDAHWRISAMPLFSDAFAFGELFEASIALPALGKHARGLMPVHAFAHASIHRASNVCSGIGDRLKWLYDLHLLAQRFGTDDWGRLLGVCRERDLCGVVAEAIAATADAFGPVVPAEVVAGTRARYVEAYERITGRRFADWYGGA